MKFRFYLLSITFALLASACTNTRYAANGEYDDVYFTSADKAAQVASNDLEGPEVYKADEDNSNYASRRERSNYRVNSYKDEVYDEDDFYFSRRLRRFSSASNSAWRYYDPYFSNDLYYVMGTNSWNRWNNFGWYSWNRPRFGSSLRWNYYNDPFYGGIYDTWGLNYGNYYNYYNPWVSTYYGYNPLYGYNPYGFGSSFNNFGFGGYGFGGYGSAFYCPPYAYTTSASGVAASRGRNWDRYYTGRRESTTSSVRTNTGYGKSSRVSPATNDRRQAARPAGYTSTRTNQTANSGMYLSPKARTQTISNRNSNISNSNTTRPSSARPANRTSPRVYTRPNSNSSYNNSGNSSLNRRSNARTNSTFSRPSNRNNRNRTYTRPSNSNRTYSRPSNSTYSRPRTSSPSRTNSSFSRPSSRSSSSSARPSTRSSSSSSSRSIRPSGSRSSSSSSSSRVRP